LYLLGLIKGINPSIINKIDTTVNISCHIIFLFSPYRDTTKEI